MKKLVLAFAALFTMTVSASAMSYEQARRQALFLTDKMAYELNLTEEQYEAAYEINLDYLMGVNSYDDLYGAYWTQRNLDLEYILLDWQYRLYLDATYFYRPLYWDAGYWRFAVYARYPHRDYFYFGYPRFYTVYRGGHSWRHNGGRSWYHGRDMRPRGDRNFSGMRDGFDRGNYGNGYSRNGNGTFGNGRGGNKGNSNNNGTFGRGNSGSGTFGRGGNTGNGRTTTITPKNNNGRQMGTLQRMDNNSRTVDRMKERENVATPNTQRNNGNSFNRQTSPTRESSTRTTVRSSENNSRFNTPSRSTSTPSRSFSTPSSSSPSRNFSTPSGNSRSMGNNGNSFNRSSSSSSRSSMGSSSPSRSSSNSSSFSRSGSSGSSRGGGGSFGSRR